jgi:hypothetical protein
MHCSDNTLDYLKRYGFNVIRFPRPDVRPLQIFAAERGQLLWMGELSTVFAPGPDVNLPPITASSGGLKISGRQTNEIDAHLGLSVLGSIIGAMGGSNIGLDTFYKQAQTIVFQFEDVREQRVAPAEVDQYLANAELSAHSRTIGQLLDADDIYVTTAVLQATSLTVAVTKSRSGGVALELPVIQELVGGNVDVSIATKDESALTYTGRVPLGFGFQAIRLSYEAGRYQAFTNVPTKVSMRGTPKPVENGDMFMSPGRFATLSFS